MILPSSHRLTQWGRLAEILGEVRFLWCQYAVGSLKHSRLIQLSSGALRTNTMSLRLTSEIMWQGAFCILPHSCGVSQNQKIQKGLRKWTMEQSKNTDIKLNCRQVQMQYRKLFYKLCSYQSNTLVMDARCTAGKLMCFFAWCRAALGINWKDKEIGHE